MCSSEKLLNTKFAHDATTLPMKSPCHTDDVDPTRPTFTPCTRYTLGAHLDQSRALDSPSWRWRSSHHSCVATARANLAGCVNDAAGRANLSISERSPARARRARHTCLTRLMRLSSRACQPPTHTLPSRPTPSSPDALPLPHVGAHVLLLPRPQPPPRPSPTPPTHLREAVGRSTASRGRRCRSAPCPPIARPAAARPARGPWRA